MLVLAAGVMVLIGSRLTFFTVRGVDISPGGDTYQGTCALFSVLLIGLGLVGSLSRRRSGGRGIAAIIISFMINSAGSMALGATKGPFVPSGSMDTGAGLALTSIGSLVALIAGISMVRAGPSRAPEPIIFPRRIDADDS